MTVTNPDGFDIDHSRLLLVEDSHGGGTALGQAVHDSALRTASIVRETTLAGALARLAGEEFDGVLIDLDLPDSRGLETLAPVLAAAGWAAVVVMTEMGDQVVGDEAVRLGATDFVTKGERRRGVTERVIDYAVRREQVKRLVHRAKQQLEAKDHFLSQISHQLIAPLSEVNRSGHRLRDGIHGPLSGAQQDELSVLTTHVDRLQAMIDDLLEVSRVQQGQVSVACVEMDLGGLLAEAVAARGAAAQRDGLRLELDCKPLPAVHADPRRVHQVLGSLLDHALRFTRVPGTVVVEAVPAGRDVLVSIRGTRAGHDDGTDIIERLAQVHDPSGIDGWGPGLFLTHELVTRQGGRLSMDLTAGHGTGVWFTLPKALRPPGVGRGTRSAEIIAQLT